MRTRRIALLGLATTLLLVAACTDSRPPAVPQPAPTTETPLAGRDCLSRGTSASAAGEGSWRRVPCDDPAALATVLYVQAAGTGVAGALAEPECSDNTDFALRTTDFAASGNGPAVSFACVRNLRPPHPSDPGEGGGFGIVEGDCVRLAEGQTGVAEARCDGTGEARPTHRIRRISTAVCPPPVDATIKIGRQAPGFNDPLKQKVGCAVKL